MSQESAYKNLTTVATAVIGAAAAGLVVAALAPELPVVAAVAGFAGTMYGAPKFDANRAEAKAKRAQRQASGR